MSTATPPSARDCLRLDAPRCLRRTQGRETFALGEDLIVKRTTETAREGLWPWFAVRSAGEREFAALGALAACGLPVPRALDWAEERRDGARVSACVMERVPHVVSLRERLAGAHAGPRRELLRALLELVVRFHAAGFIHRDLYLQHVLLRAEDDALVLIDVGRARRARSWRSRWHVKDLASVLHSMPEAVGARERLRFLAGWLDARGIRSRAARRRWVRAEERKRRRIAAHVPRDERGGTA